MADNVAITAGTGTTVAADDIGGVLHQRVKVAWGVDGAAVDASASNPFPVVETSAATRLSESDFDTKTGALTETAPATDTASSGLNGRLQRIAQRLTTALTGIVLAAGENHIGEVGGFGDRLFGEFTRPANTTAYNANDVVSDNVTTTTPCLLTNALRVNAGTGYIVRASLVTNKKSITPRFRVHLFNANTMTIAADHAQFKEVYADNALRLGYFDLVAMTTGADATNSDLSRSQDNTLRHFIKAAAATRNIYYVLETLDAFTPASGQLFRLQLFMDNN